MSSFTRERSLSIASRELDFQEFRHSRTGARHVHLACDDTTNAFLVGFLTPPPDSSGVTHVLEHLVLCGSRRFPVSDLFFAMRRRSLATGMNACSSDDYTAFHFCTRYPSDFSNLLTVYLDSVFSPRLRPLDFAREGCRVEFEKPSDLHSALRYNGVVLNEMRGAMCVPEVRLWAALKQHLFTAGAYRHNTGGDPESLTELDYEHTARFHAAHYHPGNAVFMTYGDIPVEQHHAHFEKILEGFGYMRPVDPVAGAALADGPKRVSVAYPAPEDNGEVEMALAWVLGSRSNPTDYVAAHVLEGLLFGSPEAPLRHALAGKGGGRLAARFYRLYKSTRDLVLVYGLHGCDEGQGARVEQFVDESLGALLKAPGLGPAIHTALMRVVLREQEVHADKEPYGLRLLKRTLPALMDRADAVELLDLTASFARFEERSADQLRAAEWLEQALIANPKRMRLELTPDPRLGEARRLRERERLAVLERGLDDAQRQAIAEQTARLHAGDADPSAVRDLPLPAPEELRARAESSIRLSRQNRVHCFSTCTNGLVYLHLLVTLPPLDKSLLEKLALYRVMLPLLGASPDGSRQSHTQVHASLSIRTRVSRLDAVDSYVILSGKVLATHLEDLSKHLWQAFARTRFDAGRLGPVVGQLYADTQRDITAQGHLIAQHAAAASTGPCGVIIDGLAGLGYVQAIHALYQRVRGGEGLNALARDLEEVSAVLQRCRCQAFCVGEAASLEPAAACVERDWVLKDQPLGAQSAAGELPVPDAEPTLWLVDSPVGFCARAHRTVPEGHQDVAALMVLAALLENVVLQPAVRGLGGAYGTGAAYCRDTGAFRMFSFRDPRLGATLRSFDEAETFATRGPYSDSALAEARVSALRSLESIDSPPELALRSLVDACHGRLSQHRRKLRAQILAVEREALAAAAERYLRSELANTVAIAGEQVVREDPYPGLSVRTMGDFA